MSDGTIFINYRRDDSRGDAGRLYDRLQALYPGRVFRDVGFLEPGVEWHEAIAKALGDADACIVVIGRRWLTVTDSAGRRRIDNPRDTVRQEITTALSNDMPVFPVLVGDAEMPAEEDLPVEIQGLAKRNALELSEQSWDDDFRKLVSGIERALGWGPTHRADAGAAAVAASPKRRSTSARALSAFVLVLVGVGLGFAAFRSGQFRRPDVTSAPTQIRPALRANDSVREAPPGRPQQPASVDRAETPPERLTDRKPNAPAAAQPTTTTGSDPIPHTPTVFHDCDGAPEVCAAVRAALDRALQERSIPNVRDRRSAEIAIRSDVSIIDERAENQFGTLFVVRTYSIEMTADAARWRQSVAMPSPRTFSADSRFGRERIGENAAVAAASAVEHVLSFWKKRVP